MKALSDRPYVRTEEIKLYGNRLKSSHCAQNEEVDANSRRGHLCILNESPVCYTRPNLIVAAG